VSDCSYLLLYLTVVLQGHAPHFRIPLLTLHALRFFPASPPQFYPYGEAVEPNLQRHPYANQAQERVMPGPGEVHPRGHQPMAQRQAWPLSSSVSPLHLLPSRGA